MKALRSYYVNYIEAANTLNDFGLVCGLIARSKLPSARVKEVAGGQVSIAIDAAMPLVFPNFRILKWSPEAS